MLTRRTSTALVARESDLVADYRDKVAYALALGGSGTLLPFAINNLIQGRVVLGAATAVVVFLLVLNAVAIYLGRATTALRVAIFIPSIAGLALSVLSQGMPGILWSYPALLLFHFMFERRTANMLNGVALAIIIPLAVKVVGAGLALRSAVTLGLIVAFANIFSIVVSRLQRRLEEQAVVDALTGALNRRQLEDRLNEAADILHRHQIPASLLALDIDLFKLVNDAFGHGRGDDVLRGVVDTMRHRLRRHDLLFRTGGEEFLVLLPHVSSDAAAGVAESLREAVAAAPLLPDRTVTVSIGVAEARPGEHMDAWVRRGDAALYRAKAEGRNRVVVDAADMVSR